MNYANLHLLLKSKYRVLILLTILTGIKTINGQIIYTIAGNGIAAESGDGGKATAAEMNFPNGVAIDDTGNIYVSDDLGYRVRKINHVTGLISTYAGSGKGGFAGDGGPATAAKLLSPQGMAFDKQGNLYLAEIFNQDVRKISATGIITTYAGTGSSGYTGDGGQATTATFNEPVSVAVDSGGNVYVADELNDVVRKITPAGIISTVAGNGTSGFKGDGGPATAAEITTPTDIAFDSSWNMYISDDNNYIRKVDVHTGIITSVVGCGNEGYAGDGGPATAAEIDGPIGIALDKAGDIFIVDNDNGRIREAYASTGIINTIVGNGGTGFSGDSGMATAAEVDLPFYVKLDAAGNLYFTDGGNNRVRMVTNVVGLPLIKQPVLAFNIYPNPANSYFNISFTSPLEKGSTIVLTSILGEEIWSEKLPETQTFITRTTNDLSPGLYLVTIHKIDGTSYTSKILIEK